MMYDQRQKVLIVDDTPTNIEILNELISEECEVLFALSGEDALEMAAMHEPDLILLDIMMPGMDGYEVCRRLKADPKLVAVPVIFITAMSMEEDEVRGLQMGAIDYITKPISPVITLARIRNHLELKRTRDLLAQIALIDALTGIPNRKRFDIELAKEWQRSMRSGSAVGLLMIDIDCFKNYNDHYGHPAGDTCLRAVAGAILSALRRPVDLAARYGGEEFACILPDTDLDGSLKVAGDVLRSVSDLALPHDFSTAAGMVSVSIGVASGVPPQDSIPLSLIESADQQLYRAKKQGRNRVLG